MKPVHANARTARFSIETIPALEPPLQWHIIHRRFGAGCGSVVYSIYLVFEDGKRALAEEVDRLDDAMAFALTLADDVGKRPAGDGHGPPRTVAVYRGTKSRSR